MSWHYKIGTQKTTNKLKAIKLQQESKQALTFEFPESYNDFDFSIEPEEDFYSLLVKEAKRIRETYPKIRLWYSGGCDSSLVLDVFTKNNIYIDEIHTAKTGIKEADFEIDQFAIPYLNKVRDKLTNTKITIHEPTIKDYYKFYENKNWVESFNKIHPENFQYHFRLHYINEVNSLYGNDFINIRGKDKPDVIYVNGKFYAYILDVEIEDQPYQLNFYLDNPLIHSKQSHMLKNAMKKYANNEQVSEIQKNKYTGRYDLDTNFPTKELYVHDKNGYITIKNKKINYFNKKEILALKAINKEHSKLIDLWQDGLQPLYKYQDWFNQQKPELGTIGVFSKFCCLDTKDTKTIDELYPNGLFCPIET